MERMRFLDRGAIGRGGWGMINGIMDVKGTNACLIKVMERSYLRY